MRLVQSGPRDAGIIICGESPGKTEDQTGVPFSGASGELLNSLLSRADLSRSDCFVTNVTHVRPPDDKFEWFIKPKPRIEFAQGVVQLKQDIDEIKPNLVIALGSWPLRILTGKIGIDKWRGSILESTLCPPTKVVGTYHPAYVLRMWDFKGVVEFDLRRCAKESLSRDVSRPVRNLLLEPSRADTPWLVDELRQAEWLACDIECTETDSGWRLACVGFADRPDRAVVWPCNEPWQTQAIKELCESETKKVFQNGSFDVTVLAENGISVPLQTYQWDTMLAHHSLFTECAGGSDELSGRLGKKSQAAIKKGLAFQTSIYTTEPFYKDDGKIWKQTGDLQMFYRYNALDAAVTREIRDRQEEQLEEFGTREVLAHEMSLVEPLLAMTKRGILIDMEQRKSLHEKFDREVTLLQAAVDQIAGAPLNAKSPKQMQEFLYVKLKLPVKRDRKTKNPTANKDTLLELAQKYNHPVLRMVLEIRQRRDFIERYLTAAVDSDGRMRCSFDITGTRTGRLSSRQSIYGSGTNLQNIPARKPEGEAIRRMFIADPGMAFVYCDLSQAEARIVAHLAEAQGLIDLFADPTRDVHKENAARIFGKPLNAITFEERYCAKRVLHASNYGMEAEKLMLVVNEDAATTGVRLSLAQAQNLLTRYWMLYPEIKETYWRRVEAELRSTRTLVTPFGRKRLFFGRWDDKLLREAYAYIPQSTVGDLLNKGLVRCYDMIELAGKAQLLLQVHDSILVQCPIDQVRSVADMMQTCMAIPITINRRTFTIPSDAKTGINWGTQNKDNPNGMREIE
jgi:DNA polymerase-1